MFINSIIAFNIYQNYCVESLNEFLPLAYESDFVNLDDTFNIVNNIFSKIY